MFFWLAKYNYNDFQLFILQCKDIGEIYDSFRAENRISSQESNLMKTAEAKDKDSLTNLQLQIDIKDQEKISDMINEIQNNVNLRYNELDIQFEENMAKMEKKILTLSLIHI